MTIRNAIRRVNRGIVLAAVLVVGLTGYLVYDNARFESEKTAIKKMADEYAAAAGDLNILPAVERVPGVKPSDAAVNKKLQENQAVLGKYLTNWAEYNSAYIDATRNLEMVFTNNAERRAYVTDCVYSVTSIKNLKKNGPRHARAEINIKVEMKTIGKPMFFALIGAQNTDQGYYYGDPVKGNDNGSETGIEIDTKTYTYTWEFSLYNAQLEKTGGRWKIASTNGWSHYTEGKLVEY